MGSSASREPSDGASARQITAESTSSSCTPPHRSSAHGHATSTKRHDSHTSTAQNAPLKRPPLDHIDAVNMAGSKIKKNTLGEAMSDEDLLSKKSSSDFDDEAFSKFCVEIDRATEGQESVLEASQQRRRSPVSSSTVVSAAAAGKGSLLPQLAAASTGEFADGRRGGGGPLQPRESIPSEYPSVENQLRQQQQLIRQHSDHQQQQQFEHLHHHHQQSDHGYDCSDTASKVAGAPPPLAKKHPEKPVSVWKRPEDLARRENVLRERYQDTWFQKEMPSANYLSGTSLTSHNNSSTMKMRRHSHDMDISDDTNEMNKMDIAIQEKEGFDISRFKAANKKTNSHKLDKLLPATYKGYNTSLSRQGTLPSLHRGSTSSTMSSSGTPASDRRGSLGTDITELKYNASEEALLDFIEKEFS